MHVLLYRRERVVDITAVVLFSTLLLLRTVLLGLFGQRRLRSLGVLGQVSAVLKLRVQGVVGNAVVVSLEVDGLASLLLLRLLVSL